MINVINDINALKGARNGVVDIVCNVYRMGLGESLGLIVAKTSGSAPRTLNFKLHKMSGGMKLIEM